MRHHLLVFAIALFLLPGAALAVDYSVPVNVADKAFRGTTLFAETSDPKHPRLVEVDMAGKVVWEYAIPWSIVRGGSPGQAMDVEWIPATDTILFVMPFKGIYEVDRSGKIVWEYRTKRVSHDADKLPNGNILYTFAWESPGDAEVTEITPDGKVVWQWVATDHLDRSLRRCPGPIRRDGFCHVNGAIRLDNGLTRISLRNFNMVVEVDRSGKIVWRLDRLDNGRDIRNVHDPRDTADGNIVLSTHGPQIVFILTREGRRVHKLRSPVIHLVRSHQVLPNGNILATDADKLLELTPDLAEIVWQLDKVGVQMGDVDTHGRKTKNDPREVGFYKAERIPAR